MEQVRQKATNANMGLRPNRESMSEYIVKQRTAAEMTEDVEGKWGAVRRRQSHRPRERVDSKQ